MALVSGFLTLYTWAIVCIILYFLFAIARFYQEKSGRHSYYTIYLAIIGLYALAAFRYAWLAPTFLGDWWGDTLRFIAGVTLMGASYFLLKLMIGKRS